MQERAIELIHALQMYVKPDFVKKRIILGLYKEKKIYLIIDTTVDKSGQRLYFAKFSLDYAKSTPTSKEFVRTSVRTLNSTNIVNNFYEIFDIDDKELTVDVSLAVFRKKIEESKEVKQHKHLIEPTTAEEIRRSKVERLMFKNPKFWKYKEVKI